MAAYRVYKSTRDADWFAEDAGYVQKHALGSPRFAAKKKGGSFAFQFKLPCIRAYLVRNLTYTSILINSFSIILKTQLTFPQVFVDYFSFFPICFEIFSIFNHYFLVTSAVIITAQFLHTETPVHADYRE